MKKLDSYCKKIKKQYPQTMSKEQFYQVAHIGKATALYLLRSGIVPNVNTGKKTRNYIIRTDDVIAYLYDREIHPELYKPPEGWYAGTNGRRKLIDDMPPPQSIDYTKLEEYLWEQMDDLPDLLTVDDVAMFFGYTDKTVVSWCNKGKIKHFNISGRYLIPKEYAIKALSTPDMCTKTQKSPEHKALITGYRNQMLK